MKILILIIYLVTCDALILAAEDINPEIKSWQGFKTFWKKLDTINPQNQLPLEYRDTLNADEYKNLKKVLSGLIAELEKTCGNGQLNTTEIKLLEKLCRARIDYMAFSFMSNGREIPRSINWFKQKSIRNMERNIDNFIKPRNTESSDKIINKISNNIKAWAILETLETNYGQYYHNTEALFKPEMADGDGDEYITVFENYYQNFITRKNKNLISENHQNYYKELDKRHKETKIALKSVKEVLSHFNNIIVDLITD